MKTFEILEMAKNLIKTRGWGQCADYRTLNGNECNFCMLGAIAYIASDYNPSQYYQKGVAALGKALDVSHTCLPGMMVVRYNDEDGRTKEEVLNVFDRAIVIAKAEESTSDAPSDT